jgi:8-oxo-dGTP pyrophosphatase MutT (NUDIX family)
MNQSSPIRPAPEIAQRFKPAHFRAILAKDPIATEQDHLRFGCHTIAGLAPPPDFFIAPKPAAVLVPIMAHGTGWTLLLTKRAAHLSSHAGQVAFPGGRIERGETALQAALREANEEIGLDRTFVQTLGFLPPYYSGTGFCVQPLVALIDPQAALQLDPAEVAEIFEIPLDLALNLENFKLGTIFWRGSERRYYVIDYQEAEIWGVTAGILRSLAERL